MSDIDLLKLAAKAAGYYLCSESIEPNKTFCVPLSEQHLVDGWDPVTSTRSRYEGTSVFAWNPLEDDGDALRLAVKCLPFHVLRYSSDDWEACNQNGYGATRRAIVRAAAEIGKAME